MRVVILGGTRFIGRALVHELRAHGHTLMLVHRGEHEIEPIESVEHLHVRRAELAKVRDVLAAFDPDGWVDLCAMTGDEAACAMAVAPPRARLVVVSSQDVYRAFGSVMAGICIDAVPIDESGALRTGRLPARDDSAIGWEYDPHAYEKLDVEAVYRARGGIVLRLPMTYGEHDPRRREEFVLRRLRAGRRQIPIGAANWLWSRGYVGDMASGIRLALGAKGAAGEVFNLCERSTGTVRSWLEQIVTAAGCAVEWVRVDERTLPPDLEMTRTIDQPLLFDASKARTRLGWTETPTDEAVARSVRWHLAHPPDDASTDFTSDDRALAAGRR